MIKRLKQAIEMQTSETPASNRPISNAPRFNAPSSSSVKVPLRYALILPFMILTVGATGLVGYLSWRNGQRAVNQVVNQLNREVSDRIHQKLLSYLSPPILLTQTNADLLSSGILSPESTLTQHFWQQIQRIDRGIYIYFANPQGQYIGSERFADGSLGIAQTGGEAQNDVLTYRTDAQGNPTELARIDENYDPRTRPWYVAAVEAEQPIWSEIYPDFGYPDLLTITFAQPVYNAAGELQGVVAIDYLMDEINEFLRNIRISSSGQSFVVERSTGLLVGSSNPEPIVDTSAQQRLSPLQSQHPLMRLTTEQLIQQFGNLNQITTPQQFIVSLNGERQFVQVAPFADGYGLDWLIITMIPESDFTAQIDENARTTFLLSIATLAGAIGLGLLLSQWIARPIRQLSQAGHALSEGEWHPYTTHSPITELNLLNQSFDQAAERLRRALQSSEARLNHLLDTAVAALTSKRIYPNGDWEYDYWSDNSGAVFGYTAQEIMANKTLWRSRVHPEDLDRALVEGERAYQHGAAYTEEYRFYHKDGSLRWVSEYVTSHYRPDDQQGYWQITAISIDITDRKRAEAAIQQQAEREQLLRSITQRIRQSLDLDEILTAAVTEVRQTLQADRALIFHLTSQGSGLVLKESVIPNYPTTAAMHWEDEHFPLECYHFYCQGKPRIVLDVETDEWAECLAAFMQEVGVRSKVVAPIVQTSEEGATLWGLLIVHACAQPRQWQLTEAELLQQIANQLAIAIQQANLYQQVQTELNERKQAEAALRQSQTRLQNLATAAPVNVYSMVQHPDGSLEFEYINRVVETFHEVSLEEFVSNPTEYVIGQMHPEDRAGYFAASAQSAETLSIFRYEWRIVPPSGKMRWLQAYSQPERRENGDLCWHGVVMDVTDRKLAEAELRHSEAVLQRAQQVAHVGSWELNPQTESVNWTEESYHIFGLDPAQPEPSLSEFYQLVHPEDLPELRRSVQHTVKTQAPYKVEFRACLPDGSVRYVEARGEAILDEQGQVSRLIGTNLDITERKQIEESIRHSEATKNQILKAIPDLIVWMTADGTCIDLIDGSDISTFIPRSIAIGKNLFDYMPPDLAQARIDAIQRALYTGDVQVYEQELVNDGSVRCEEVRIVAIDENKVLTIIRDITDRKQAEARLEAQRAFLRQVIDAIPNPVFVKDTEGRFIVANQALADIHGVAVNDIPGKRITDFSSCVDAALSNQFMAENQTVIATRQVRQNAPYEMTTVKGEQQWYQTILSPFIDANGQVQGVVGNSVNITDLKQVEAILQQQNQALRESEERFRSAFQDAPIGMALIGLDDRWLKVNPVLCEMLGYHESELLSMQATTLVHPEDVEMLGKYIEQVSSNQHRSTTQVKLRYQCKGGRTAWGVMNLSLVRNTEQQPLYYVTQVQDVTERQAIERMKNEFISIVSHELRTPLTAIRGFLGLIDTGIYDEKPDKAKRMIKLALTNSDRLVRLVNDILDLERLDSGRVDLVMEICDAAALLQQAVEGVQSIADAAEVRLEILPTTAQVWASPDAILQTLTNLLSNAIKFSPPASVVTLSAQPQADVIRFQVQDQGRGIPVDKLETIFGRFQQVDVSDARQKGGTGLGLAICQSIVHQHGGNIWAESRLGEGSVFCFTLPVPKA
jgi:PAS domain S-box-containing protein